MFVIEVVVVVMFVVMVVVMFGLMVVVVGVAMFTLMVVVAIFGATEDDMVPAPTLKDTALFMSAPSLLRLPAASVKRSLATTTAELSTPSVGLKVAV
jgi:hypothetical protein